MKLTKKNIAFIEHITNRLCPETFGNGAQSAIKAGYSVHAARQTGSYLLTNPNIQALIAQKENELKEAQKNTKEGILKDLYAMRDETKDFRLKLQIIDRIMTIEGFEAPKRTENKNENMNLDINGILDKAQDAMREELAKFNRG